MAGSVQTLSDETFKETIKNGVTLVDFWAEWCGPCRMQGPIIEQLAGKIGERAKIAKLDVDEAKTIAAQYKVMSIPTIIIYKDGEVIKQFVGVQNEITLAGAIDEALK